MQTVRTHVENDEVADVFSISVNTQTTTKKGVEATLHWKRQGIINSQKYLFAKCPRGCLDDILQREKNARSEDSDVLLAAVLYIAYQT